MKTLEETLGYWENPGGENDPSLYVNGIEKTEFLINKIERYIDKNDSILELGCNIGRNLNGLWNKGFCWLWGVDINLEALNLCFDYYYTMASNSMIIQHTIHEFLINEANDFYNIIFTMAVLCHIHPDVENVVFDNMVRVCKKYILTIEDERKKSNRHFMRNYKDVFELRGMREIDSRRCNGIVNLGNNYIYRIFKK